MTIALPRERIWILIRKRRPLAFKRRRAKRRPLRTPMVTVKLNWRVDWPARWSLLSVAVEPFGRDHGTKGGSYDTGVALIRELFKAEPPIPYPYEFINLRGYTKKMSASEGTGIMPLETLEVMPPAVLKHFVLSARPSLQLFFDVGQGFGRMFETFDEQWRGF